MLGTNRAELIYRQERGKTERGLVTVLNTYYPSLYCITIQRGRDRANEIKKEKGAEEQRINMYAASKARLLVDYLYMCQLSVVKHYA